MKSKMLALLLAVMAVGCVEKEKQLTAAERERVKTYVRTSKPSPNHALNVDFDGRVTLLGYDIESDAGSKMPNEWRPGQTLTVTWYWHAVKDPGDDWKIFTHLASPTNGVAANRDGGSVIRDFHQPSRWKAGQFIVDEQKLDLPRDWSGKTATVYVGLWKKNARMPIKAGANDGDDRARAFSLNVSSKKEDVSLPQLTARQASEAPKIDGKLDGPWNNAAWTDYFVNTMNSSQAEPKARVKVLYDDAYVYFGFDVEDDYLLSPFDKDGEHLWKADCVEVMLDPGGDGKNYFELQVSPKGKVFSTRYDSRRNPQPYGHTDWKSEITAATLPRGKVGDDEEDKGYSAEIRVPWSSFATGTPPASPPSQGEIWRINFFVMDSRKSGQRAVGWSAPRVGDFHTLAQFGSVRFGLPKAVVPSSAAGEVPSRAPIDLQTPIGHRSAAELLGVGPAQDAPVVNGKKLSPAGMQRILRQRQNKPAPGETVPTKDNPVSKVDKPK